MNAIAALVVWGRFLLTCLRQTPQASELRQLQKLRKASCEEEILPRHRDFEMLLPLIRKWLNEQLIKQIAVSPDAANNPMPGHINLCRGFPSHPKGLKGRARSFHAYSLELPDEGYATDSLRTMADWKAVDGYGGQGANDAQRLDITDDPELDEILGGENFAVTVRYLRDQFASRGYRVCVQDQPLYGGVRRQLVLAW